MIVIADTTPLRHLAAIGQVELLRQMYGFITVPSAVWLEMSVEATPLSVKSWIGSAPAWIGVKKTSVSSPASPEMAALDRGEREAIALALELNANLLLMDDRDGRTTALALGLPVVGTLGVLERADALQMISDLPRVLQELRASGFYLSDSLYEILLVRYRQRNQPLL